MNHEDLAVAVFERCEATLRELGDLSVDSRETFGKEYGQRVLPVRTEEAFDNEYYLAMSFVVFFSGFRSSVVENKARGIKQYFGEVDSAAALRPEDIEGILQDRAIIRNRNKVTACVHNAREFLRIRERHGSFGRLLLSFGPPDAITQEDLDRLRLDLMHRFRYLGPATVNHFLLDYGYSVVKPDRMVMRVLHRTGLVMGTKGPNYPEASAICRTIANRLGLSMRYVDWVLVGLGMEGRAGICRKNAPVCHKCLIADLCGFSRSRSTPPR